PLFAERKLIVGALGLIVLVGSVVSHLLIRNLRDDQAALASPPLIERRVRSASWIWVLSVWSVIVTAVLFDGGISSRYLFLLPTLIVATEVLLGRATAWRACGFFLIFTVVLALLDLSGTQLPRIFANRTVPVWYISLLGVGLVTLPLVHVFSVLSDAL